MNSAPRRRPPIRFLLPILLATLLTSISPLRAQNTIVTRGAVGGVSISTEGLLQIPRTTSTAPAPPAPSKKSPQESLAYISLPRALDAWKTARDLGQDPSADIRFLKGLTQIQHLFLFPDSHDIVLAGPAEALTTDNPLEPLGTTSGRPAVQLEDLIVALRCLSGDDAPRARFGCSLDPPPENTAIRLDIIRQFESGPRPRLVAELQKALLPQQVRLFGVPDDSRLALAMLAADYRLKRLIMGIDPLPPGLANGLGNEQATARVWFEPAYEPLLTTPDGLCFSFRGPRLKVLAAKSLFDADTAAPAQKKFAEQFSARLPDVAARSPAIADLQNITDCFLVATLIHHDQLDRTAGLDLSWLLDAQRYKVASLPVPKTAQTLVHTSGNLLAQGGVALSYRTLADITREQNDTTALAIPLIHPTTDWYVLKDRPH